MRTWSNHVLYIHSLTDVDVLIAQNQRCATVIVENCVRVKVILVDSAVVTSKTLRAVNCDGITLYCY